MKYKVGQKFMVEMREGYHLAKIVRREIENNYKEYMLVVEVKKE